MICATASGSYGLFYAFKEAHKTSAACFIQLVHTGIGQHLCEHLAHLILQDEVGQVFAQVLADAGVYKLDEAGRAGFVRFLESVK